MPLLFSTVVAMSRSGLVRKVAGSALGHGCCEWWVRCSTRTDSGLVMVAGFLTSSQAGLFASRWARRLGVQVRVSRLGQGWVARVPVHR